MAIKEIRREWSPCQLDYVKEFLLHSEADVKDLPACCVGSKARVSETGNVYTCSASGEWAVKDDGGVDECESAAHKMYVTDADGKPHWEDMLAYEESAVVEIMPTTDVGVIWYSQKTIACPYEGKVKIGDTGSFILDGVPHDYVAIEDIGNPPAEMTLDVDGVSNYVKLSSGKNMILYNIGMHPTQSHTIALTVNSKITKTIDPKYLPSGSGGGGVMMITAELTSSTEDLDNPDTVQNPSHTYEEVKAAVDAGKYCILVAETAGAYLYTPMTAATDAGNGMAYGFAMPGLQIIVDKNGWMKN